MTKQARELYFNKWTLDLVEGLGLIDGPTCLLIGSYETADKPAFLLISSHEIDAGPARSH